MAEPKTPSDVRTIDEIEIEIGRILGRRKAFVPLAGRCSAAQAAALKTIRDEKRYACLAPTWDEFCTVELRMSQAEANRIVHWFEEFGPAYFELLRLTPVSPEEYRRLAPYMAGRRLQFNGQSIALVPEKAEAVASAIAEIRKTLLAGKSRISARQRLAALRRRCEKIGAEFENLSEMARPEEREELSRTLMHLIGRLRRIEQQL